MGRARERRQHQQPHQHVRHETPKRRLRKPSQATTVGTVELGHERRQDLGLPLAGRLRGAPARLGHGHPAGRRVTDSTPAAAHPEPHASSLPCSRVSICPSRVSSR